MKKILFTLAALTYSAFVFAQYEGTVTWSMKLEITDPKVKAQMEKMNSPEVQAQMKLLEEKMNDPQFKSLMESNPEVKAMLEKQLEAIKGGNGGNMIENMMPKSVVNHVKNGNSLSKVVGGAFETETLYLKDGNKSYTIDRKNKTYTLHTPAAEDAKHAYKVTKTEEFATILAYKCRKFLVESAEGKEKVIYHVWATPDFKELDAKQFSKMRVGNAANTGFMEKIEGVPLKMQASLPQGKMTMEVTEIKKETLDDALFQLPEGFKAK